MAELLRPCTSQPCNQLVATGMCAAHARAKDRSRGTTNERGYNWQWRRLRISFLKELCPQCGDRPVVTCAQCGGTGLANHFCGECMAEGILAPAEEVDHILGKDRQDLRLARWNLQGLCVTHHARKSRAEANGLDPSPYQMAKIALANSKEMRPTPCMQSRRP